MRLIRLLCASAVLASLLAFSSGTASAAPVVYCGIVKANSVASGAGSGPRVLELQASTGPGGAEQRFSVPESIPLSTVGSYICGQFEQGAPSMALVALMRPGDPGYVAQPGVPVASGAPQAITPPQTGLTLGFFELLLGLAAFAAVTLIVMRSRRSRAAA